MKIIPLTSRLRVVSYPLFRAAGTFQKNFERPAHQGATKRALSRLGPSVHHFLSAASIQIENLIDFISFLINPLNKIFLFLKLIFPFFRFQACKGCVANTRCQCVAEKGFPGETGLTGLRGSQGIPGDIGPEGPPGPYGPNGDGGSIGGMGEKGHRVNIDNYSHHYINYIF